MYGTDNGFEDREGHQAPFTLRKRQTSNAQRRTPNVQLAELGVERWWRAELLRRRWQRIHLSKGSQKLAPPGEFVKRRALLDLLNDLVKIRPIAGFQFGMHELAVGANFESPTTGRNKGKRFDALSEFKNLGRQTDGLGRVVSNHAIFDRHLGFHP